MPEPAYEGVIVLGSPRSGTTLTRRLLNAHPSIACPPETSLLSAAARFLEEQPVAGGLTVGAVPGLAFSGYEGHEVIERLREFVFGFFREIAAKAGKPIWGEKTAFDGFHAAAIERLCADRVRYVCVVRHPLDVVCSIKELTDKMGIYFPELHEYVRRYPAPLEAFAHAWNDLNLGLISLPERNPELAFILKYDDLVADPGAAIGAMLEFLGLPTDVDAMIGAAMGGSESVGFGDWKTYQRKGIDRSSVGRWASLDPNTISNLTAIVGDTMERLGFDPVESEEAIDDEEARRRYEIGLMVARMRKSST